MSDKRQSAESTQDDDGSSFDDMEMAYREALAALDAAEVQVGTALVEAVTDGGQSDSDSSDQAFVSIGDDLARDLQANDVPADLPMAIFNADSDSRVSPREVIEAVLFVGGDVALTARRLTGLIGNDLDSRVAVKIIDQLNDQYAREQRPYEIRLHEGGFCLQLREEYARLQSQVHGTGPREVRLSPEALELLAFVAWNQPVSPDDLTTTGHQRPMTTVRQLIRLQLVHVERTGTGRTDVVYRTGQRFLDLFQLNSLDDLPQADVFAFK